MNITVREQPPLAYAISGAVAASGIGRTSLYGAIKSGLLPIRKFGARTLVLRADLEAFLANLERAA